MGHSQSDARLHCALQPQCSHDLTAFVALFRRIQLDGRLRRWPPDNANDPFADRVTVAGLAACDCIQYECVVEILLLQPVRIVQIGRRRCVGVVRRAGVSGRSVVGDVRRIVGRNRCVCDGRRRLLCCSRRIRGDVRRIRGDRRRLGANSHRMRHNIRRILRIKQSRSRSVMGILAIASSAGGKLTSQLTCDDKSTIKTIARHLTIIQTCCPQLHATKKMPKPC